MQFPIGAISTVKLPPMSPENQRKAGIIQQGVHWQATNPTHAILSTDHEEKRNGRGTKVRRIYI